jgi:hypothetical protein
MDVIFDWFLIGKLMHVAITDGLTRSVFSFQPFQPPPYLPQPGEECVLSCHKFTVCVNLF